MGTKIGSAQAGGPRQIWGQNLATRARTLAIVTIGLAAFIAGGALTYYPETFERLREVFTIDLANIMDNGLNLMRIVLILMALSHTLFGCYVVWLSMRALFAGQYPPPGAKVARNQNVLYGGLARFRAAAGIAFGMALIVAGVMIPYFAYQTTKIFFDTAGGFPIDPNQFLKFR